MNLCRLNRIGFLDRHVRHRYVALWWRVFYATNQKVLLPSWTSGTEPPEPIRYVPTDGEFVELDP